MGTDCKVREQVNACIHMELVVDLRLSARAKCYRFFAYFIGFEGVHRQISMILRAAEQAQYVWGLSSR